jgi:hypothetical protein
VALLARSKGMCENGGPHAYRISSGTLSHFRATERALAMWCSMYILSSFAFDVSKPVDLRAQCANYLLPYCVTKKGATPRT